MVDQKQQTSKSSVFHHAKMNFKRAAGVEVSPAEGVAVQVRLEDDETTIFAGSNMSGGNSMLEVCLDIQSIPLSRKFKFEAIAIATQLNTDTGNTFEPQPETLERLYLLIKDQEVAPDIFIIEGHSADLGNIREYKFPS